MSVKANWSGMYPCLCSGEWTLFVNDKDVTEKIPEELRTEPMYTFGTYQTWYFEDDWEEVFEDYEDGMSCKEWIENNDYWLKDITDDYKVKEEIYFAIQDEDFRHNSCGGCI